MSWEILLSAVLVGLLGGVHCVGMCSGMVGAFTFGLPASVQQARWRTFLFQLFYNLGRITTYGLLGAAFGWLGAQLANLAAFVPVQRVLLVFAGVMMVLLGLYLAGIWRGLALVEQTGGRLWQRVQPLTRHLVPVDSLLKAYGYGLIWGLLPCGLVYSVLIWALSAGGALQGALLLLAFGLGTLPNLLLMGVLAFMLVRLSRNLWVQRGAGLLVMAFGLYQLWLAATLSV
ncbi:MAG TPA: sulfite exporter TauE/SafE family protein [Piscirickettsiaceae bacterium]|nr:sulfite exporter TauE/SafE family protein [Piscirickettsiaceae bacterium]